MRMRRSFPCPRPQRPEDTRRIVIAEFPDVDSAERCHRSQAYQEIIEYRKGCATFESILVDGVRTA